VGLSEEIRPTGTEGIDGPRGENKRKRKENGVGLGKENRWATQKKQKRGERKVGWLLG
jgi:hypothetical protein